MIDFCRSDSVKRNAMENARSKICSGTAGEPAVRAQDFWTTTRADNVKSMFQDSLCFAGDPIQRMETPSPVRSVASANWDASPLLYDGDMSGGEGLLVDDVKALQRRSAGFHQQRRKSQRRGSSSSAPGWPRTICDICRARPHDKPNKAVKCLRSILSVFESSHTSICGECACADSTLWAPLLLYLVYSYQVLVRPLRTRAIAEVGDCAVANVDEHDSDPDSSSL